MTLTDKPTEEALKRDLSCPSLTYHSNRYMANGKNASPQGAISDQSMLRLCKSLCLAARAL